MASGVGGRYPVGRLEGPLRWAVNLNLSNPVATAGSCPRLPECLTPCSMKHCSSQSYLWSYIESTHELATSQTLTGLPQLIVSALRIDPGQQLVSASRPATAAQCRCRP